MKIAISAVSAKMGGAVTYLTNVLRCLPRPGSGYEFVVFLLPETAAQQNGLAANIRLIPTLIGHAPWWKRMLWEQITLRRHLKREKVDVLFSSANFGMFRCPVRQILLERNALHFSSIYMSEFLARHSFRFRLEFRLRGWLMCKSVQSADIVMTPTQAMLDELRQFVEVEPWRAVVNPYGVNLQSRIPTQPEGENSKSEGDKSPPVRLLYVSVYGEHKNFSTLLKAMPLLNRDGAVKFHLRTTLDPASEVGAWTVTHRSDLELASRADVAPYVERLGVLGREETEELYHRSDIFVFPSLSESFGFPMVEAMAHGLPIVAADTPVNREICAGAAVYFSPFSVEELAQQVRALAGDPGLRAKLGTLGRQRAASFTWPNHVLRLMKACESQNLSPADTPTARSG